MKINQNTMDVSALMNKFNNWNLGDKLQVRKDEGTFRSLKTVSGRSGAEIIINGRKYINFSSNDYLGMSVNPELQHAWEEGIRIWGCGSGASPLVTGHCSVHEELCRKISLLLGKEKVLLFNSGFAANQAIIKTFASRCTGIYMDRLAHASLQEAAHLSGGKLYRFGHNDPGSLRRLLEKNYHSDLNSLIVTEGVFSMDGDEAPLAELTDLAEEFQIPLMVDDAHGFGVHGTCGLGTIPLKLKDFSRVDIVMGTFGKAFGTMGAFVASSAEVIDYMVNFSREYIYSTYMPPSSAAASLFSLEFVTSHEELRDALRNNVQIFHEGFNHLRYPLSSSKTSIQPVIIGDSLQTLKTSQILAEEGIWVGAIRPPTVPWGSARLRVTITAAHTEEQINCLIAGLEKCQTLQDR